MTAHQSCTSSLIDMAKSYESVETTRMHVLGNTVICDSVDVDIPDRDEVNMNEFDYTSNEELEKRKEDILAELSSLTPQYIEVLTRLDELDVKRNRLQDEYHRIAAEQEARCTQ